MTPQDVAKKIEDICDETGYAVTSIGQNACGNAKLYERSLKAPDRYSHAIERLDEFLDKWRKENPDQAAAYKAALESVSS